MGGGVHHVPPPTLKLARGRPRRRSRAARSAARALDEAKRRGRRHEILRIAKWSFLLVLVIVLIAVVAPSVKR
jgi:hypothetical protein